MAVPATLRWTDALIIVDVQNDFCPGGALAVPEGDKVVPALNEWIDTFAQHTILPIFFSRDWHPGDTSHFSKWPKHCIQNTAGANFHPNLQMPRVSCVVSKGSGKDEDAYSAFDGSTDDGTLAEALAWFEKKRLFVGGLATDYCVKATVLDALKRGFEVVVIKDACRAVNVRPLDGDLAIEEMAAAGAVIM